MILQSIDSKNTVLNYRLSCSVNESEVTDSVMVLKNTSTDPEKTVLNDIPLDSKA